MFSKTFGNKMFNNSTNLKIKTIESLYPAPKEEKGKPIRSEIIQMIKNFEDPLKKAYKGAR